MSALHIFLAMTLLGQAPDKEASLEGLKARVAPTRIVLASGSRKGHEAKLLAAPIFRYSDALRDIEDAGIWIWTEENRPVAAMKVERYRSGRFPIPWLYCFASLSPDLVRADWPDALSFESREPGIKWQSLHDEPAATRTARLLQMRKLARQFSAEILENAAGDKTRQTRMLTQPLHRCDESVEVLDGAIFGFTGTGTNPDVLLIFDLPQEAGWRFGVVGMTAEGLRVKRDETLVYESPYTVDQGNVFDTWSNFHPRK